MAKKATQGGDTGAGMSLSMTIRQYKSWLADNIRWRTEDKREDGEAPEPFSALVRGGSGIGKTDVPRQVADELGIGLVEDKMIKYEQTEFDGFLMFDPDKKAAEFFASHLERKVDEALKAKGRVIVHLDEYNLCKSQVLSASYQFILDHELRGRRYGADKVFVIASGNRVEDRANVTTIPMPLMRRFRPVDVEPHFLEWTQDYAIPKKLHPFVIAFIHFRNELFHKLPDADVEEQYPTPAGYTSLSRHLKWVPVTDPRLGVYAAPIVGKAVALEFAEYCKCKDQIDRMLDAIHNENYKAIPTEPSLLYALNQFLVAEFREKPKVIVDRIMRYACHLPEERADIAAALCKSMLGIGAQHKQTVAGSKEFPRFAEKYGKYYLAE